MIVDGILRNMAKLSRADDVLNRRLAQLFDISFGKSGGFNEHSLKLISPTLSPSPMQRHKGPASDSSEEDIFRFNLKEMSPSRQFQDMSQQQASPDRLRLKKVMFSNDSSLDDDFERERPREHINTNHDQFIKPSNQALLLGYLGFVAEVTYQLDRTQI